MREDKYPEEKKYFPYDYLSDRLYYRVFADVKEESPDWGLLPVEWSDETLWEGSRIREAEKMGKACMKANVEKSLLLASQKIASNREEIWFASTPMGENCFL